jgi:pimeloyl-ACP methyl ester carboxylesterase
MPVHDFDSENRRTFLRRGAVAIGAASAACTVPGLLFAEPGGHRRSDRQPGCDYTEIISGNQYGFRVFGSGSATPRHHVFFFHGMPVSRLDGCILHQAAAAQDVQIISVDRPGIGLSCYQPERTVLSTADDFHDLATVLGFGDSYSIIGHSFGCIAAAACGKQVSSARGLKKVALVAPFAPNWMTGVPSKAGKFLRRVACDGALGRNIFRLIRSGTHDGLPTSRMLIRMAAINLLPDADREYADSELTVQSMGQCSTQGPHGPLRELQLGLCDWKFKLQEIKEGNRFKIWNGVLDDFTPTDVGCFFAEGNDRDAGIRDSEICISDGDGHYSILGTCGNEIIQSILP